MVCSALYFIHAFVFYALDHKELCSSTFCPFLPCRSKDLASVSRDEIKWLKNIILHVFNLQVFESDMHVNTAFFIVQFLDKIGH